MSKQIRNMSRVRAMDSLPIETWSRSLIMKVKDFSNETVHKPGELTESSFSNIEFRRLEEISLVLFANGMASEDKGYVTVEFEISSNVFKVYLKVFELSCVFSVIDDSGNKRFPRSCVIHSHSYWSDFDAKYDPIIVDRLLKRDFLLSDKDDLLPGDCLSLHIDVDMRTIDYIPTYIEPSQYTSYVLSSFFAPRANEFYLDLNSEVGRRLTEVSSFFQRFLETPMVETKTRCMKLAEGEFPSLRDVGEIVMGAESFLFHTLSEICQMYTTADMYDVPIAIESCRNLLATFLRVRNDPDTAEHVKENIPSLLELAEKYNDVQLKENIEIFLKKSREDGEFGRCIQITLQSNLETEWKFERVAYDNNKFYFRCTRNIDERPLVNYYN